MSLQIRTIIDGAPRFLDLYQDEPVLLSLSFAELQDITKKNSAYSKAFSLPGSKNNNQIFNYFYDLNSVPVDFDANNKFNSTLMWDGYQILEGYIRLNGVTVEKDEIVYQVTFYNQVGDLAANIGDKYLYNTDLSSLSHPYSLGVVLESGLDPNLFMLTGTTNYSYQNGKTMWGLYNIGYEYTGKTTQVNTLTSPLVNFTPVSSYSSGTTYTPAAGNFDYSGTPVHDYYYKPTLQVKALYKQICKDAGYDIESKFFDTSYFDKFYMPLKFLDETIYAKNAIQACLKFGPQQFSLFDEIHYINPQDGLQCNSLGFPLTDSNIYVDEQYASTYTIRFTFQAIESEPCNPDEGVFPQFSFYFTDGFVTTNLYETSLCSAGVQTISFDQVFNITGSSYLSLYFTGNYVNISGFTSEIINGPRFLPSGTTINYAEEFPNNDYSQLDFITSINKYFNLVVVPSTENPNTLVVEPIVDFIGKGRILDWTTKVDFSQLQSFVPTTSLLNGTLQYEFKLDQDYANQDFKTQANRIFGSDKFKLGLEYKDTITKFDYLFSSPIDITISNSYVPLITLSSMSKLKSIDVSGTSQQTFVPFKILPKLVFRGPTLPNDNYGFISGATFGGGGSIFCTSGVTLNVTAPGYLRYNDCDGYQTYEYVNTGTKVYSNCINPSTFGSGVPFPSLASYTITSSGTPCGQYIIQSAYQTYYMNTVQMDRFTNMNRFTTYPFAYTGFSHYINYRGEDKTNITPSEFTFISEDLYDVYYRPYIDDLISPENKIYSAKIYLYPQEIQDLKWNEKILINNTYFRINKISNYNITEPSICDIELIKLTKDYPGHRVLYYQLIPCAEGATLYSNSDLNYHLYAYAGNFVTLYDDDLNYLGCYNVEIDAFNETYDYRHYYISTAYTQNLVNVFSDCGCSGRTEMSVVQEEPGVPRYFAYEGTACYTTDVYRFLSTDGALTPTTDTIKLTNTATTETICVTGITSTFMSDVQHIALSSYLDCEACYAIPPSATPTHTPTPTPTATPVIPPYPCSCYEIVMTSYNPEGPSGAITFRNCFDDSSVGRIFSFPGTYYQCAVSGSIEISFGTGTITELSSYCLEGCPPAVTPTPTGTMGATPTPTATLNTTPTPTITQTPSGTATISYNYYYADRYQCLNPGCSFDTPAVVVVLPSSETPNYGKFYNSLFDPGFSYLLDSPTTGGPGLILQTLNYTACNDACIVV